MKTWDTVSALSELWAGLSGSSVTLILDYDGTLSPFVPNPEAARPYPGIPEILNQLSEAGCRLVFVTGRNCRQLPVFLGMEKTPEVWGSHGGERLCPDGTIEATTLRAEQEQGLKRARSWAVTAGYGQAVEVKPGCLSFHIRSIPTALSSGVLLRVHEMWLEIAGQHELELRPFDGGVELRSADVHKGLAVARVLKESSKETRIFYLGDDQTDEDGFVALEGNGIGILVRPEYRETQADWWVRPPGELLDFLNRVLVAISKG